MTLQVLAALFAVVMLVRYVPQALRALRAGAEERRRSLVVFPIVNVLIAVALLAMAVKGLARVLISR